MSAHNDPSTHVPDGSFYNFVSADVDFAPNNPHEYYNDVVLECSSLLTDENMGTLEHAVEIVTDHFAARSDPGVGALRLDYSIRTFQNLVGQELLAELRTGLDYINRHMSGPDGLLSTIYTRNLDSRVFRKRMKEGLGTVNASRYVLHQLVDLRTPSISDQNAGMINMSHYASYLSNVAVWMQRQTAPDMGVVHLLSLLLARGSERDTHRDRDRVNEAMAVISAEHVRRPYFVEELDSYDGVRHGETAINYHRAVSGATWDQNIVSLHSQVTRLKRAIGVDRMCLADILPLYIDNRLVVAAQSEQRVEVGTNIFEPKLVEFDGTHTSTQASVFAIVAAMQDRTELFPHLAPFYCLDDAANVGIPMLFARTRMGHPAFLVPADDKCLSFMSKLYSAKLPSPLNPLEMRSELVWAYRYDPQQLMQVLRQFQMGFRYQVHDDTFAVPGMLLGRMECTGTNDLGYYIQNVSETDMFVNEITVY